MTLEVLGVLLMIIVGAGATKNNQMPKNLGVIDGKLAALSSKPNCVSSQTDVKAKYVEPLNFKEDLESSKIKVISVIEGYSGAKIIKNEDNYIYAVFTTGTMRYKDDVEFYFDEMKKVIHYRSSSRIGYSDMGLNRKRYNKISKKYYE